MWQLASGAAWAPEYLVGATPGGKVARSAVQPQCFAQSIAVDAADLAASAERDDDATWTAAATSTSAPVARSRGMSMAACRSMP